MEGEENDELFGSTKSRSCSALVGDLLPGRMILLSNAYEGPDVIDGNPRS